MRTLPILTATVLISFMTAVFAQAEPEAEEEYEISYGEAEYFNSCAVCHGLEGRGDGFLATELRTRPTDLSLLSARNSGVFPYWRVYATIDGRHVVPGHGERDMPVWGRHFIEEDAAAFGQRGGAMVTSERIHELTLYIQSLQR